jgi:hypothetical protein
MYSRIIFIVLSLVVSTIAAPISVGSEPLVENISNIARDAEVNLECLGDIFQWLTLRSGCSYPQQDSYWYSLKAFT